MKIRTGFVSNSSSSSFVVSKTQSDWSAKGKQVVVLTPKQEKALKAFGFYRAYIRSPYLVPFGGKGQAREEKKFASLSVKKPTKRDYAFGKKMRLTKQQVDSMARRERESYAWCYSIICNQDEVIKFLVENQIPFEANIHYDHQTYFYIPKSDCLVIAQNFGNQFSTYTSDIEGIKAEGKSLEKPVKFLVASEYIKQV
jgi:hypothetical protein